MEAVSKQAGRVSMGSLRAAVAALGESHVLSGLFEAPTTAELARLASSSLLPWRQSVSGRFTPTRYCLPSLPERAVKGRCPLGTLRLLRG